MSKNFDLGIRLCFMVSGRGRFCIMKYKLGPKQIIRDTLPYIRMFSLHIQNFVCVCSILSEIFVLKK